MTTDSSNDFTPYETNIVSLSTPPVVIKMHAGVPAWACVSVAGVTTRIKLDPAGGQGLVTFTPDA